MTREVLAGGAGTALGTLPCTGLNLTRVVLPGFALLMAAGAVWRSSRRDRLCENALRTSCGHPDSRRDAAVAWRGDQPAVGEPFAGAEGGTHPRSFE
jgi:hypothetical protein